MRALRWAALAACLAGPVQAAEPFRAVMNIELQVLDPILTTATVTRALGYMIYDMLIAMDSKGEYHPQMLESWKSSDDRMIWTMTLRPGLTWHDGAPVTPEDCIASIKRWAQMDAFGKRMMAATAELRVVDDRSFQIVLSRPFAFVIEALGKPNAMLPVMMPARMAATPATKANVETIGSGPFTFNRNEWRPGDRAIFRRNPAYKPRAEPADGFAGGKVANFDSIELVSIPDPGGRVTALEAGAVDYVEILTFDYIEKMRKDPRIKVMEMPAYAQTTGGLSVNNLIPPFNDVRMRRAVQIALDQKEIMAGMGLPADMYLPFCQSVFLCGGPYGTDVGNAYLREASAAKAQALLKEAGYKGEKIVLLHSIDSATINPISLVVIDQLKRAGFNVEVVASDYSSLAQRRTKKDPIEQGGWNLMPVVWSGYDMINPLSHYTTAYSCGGSYPGWNCDPGMPDLVAKFEVEADREKRMALAKEMQLRVLDQAPQMFLGQFSPPAAHRSNIKGMINTGLSVFWNARREAK